MTDQAFLLDMDRPVKGMTAGNIPFTFQLKKYFTLARGNPIPPNERAIVCDTSHWDGEIQFPTMYNAGARGCYFKATQGISLADDQFATSRANCTNMPWGAYHFLINYNGTDQANFFCDTVGITFGLLPPVLDVELPSVNASVVRAFVTRILDRLHCFPMIYTSAYFWSLVSGTADKTWISERCPLWVAHYGTDYPLLPPGWTDYTMHQYSADGNNLGPTYGGQGDDMDLNRARIAWLPVVNPPQTIEQRVTALETEARAHGWSV